MTFGHFSHSHSKNATNNTVGNTCWYEILHLLPGLLACPNCRLSRRHKGPSGGRSGSRFPAAFLAQYPRAGRGIASFLQILPRRYNNLRRVAQAPTISAHISVRAYIFVEAHSVSSYDRPRVADHLPLFARWFGRQILTSEAFEPPT